MKLFLNLVIVVQAVLDEVIFKWKEKASGVSSVSAPSSITSYTALAFIKQNVPISTFHSIRLNLPPAPPFPAFPPLAPPDPDGNKI